MGPKCKLKEIEGFIKRHCNDMETEVLFRKYRETSPIDFKIIFQRLRNELQPGEAELDFQNVERKDRNQIFDFLLYWLQTKKQGMFYCPNCTWRFRSGKIFRAHLRNAHLNPKPKQSCPFCDNKEFINLEDHIAAKHTHEKGHKCPFCNKEFRKGLSCKYHINLHHTQLTSYPCHICHKEDIYTPAARSFHINQHHRDKDRIYDCPNCSKKFRTTGGLRFHSRREHDECPEMNLDLSCKFCGKVYSHQLKLNQHVYQCHIRSPLQYHCSLCPKVFVSGRNLEWHVRTHTRETPYPCTSCGKAFKTESNLKQHSRTHSHLKPFSCQQCNVSFKFRHHLKNHFKTDTHIGNLTSKN